jgi:hypothetical protein
VHQLINEENDNVAVKTLEEVKITLFNTIVY